MEATYINNELYHFLESASDETLQNFLRSLALRPEVNPELHKDLNRIVESNGNLRIKLSELMVDYN